MSEILTIAPRAAFQTFMDFPLHTDLATLEADVAILGLPYGDPYHMDEVTNDQTNAPTAIRVASKRLQQSLDRWDFDFNGTLFDNRPIRVVDVGDVPGDTNDLKAHYRRAEAAARIIFDKGALLITFGGDHGVPIPIFRALENHGPVTLVHIDAHLDWRDDVNGVREGYSSTIRRASEMPWIDRIFQIGIRGTGSAREDEYRAALDYGAEIITSWDLHDHGMAAVLERIPNGGPYYLTIDADGVDPTVMPAVAAPQGGGVLYHQMRALIHGLVEKGRVLGMDVVEITPARDLNEITSLTAGRFACNLIGTAVRAGYFS
ncbi:MAG: arginase [Alphaproteobacteria bacterium]|nr:arginase [Alphaproteobacteria bacterium]